jgi:hypothetical protein
MNPLHLLSYKCRVYIVSKRSHHLPEFVKRDNATKLSVFSVLCMGSRSTVSFCLFFNLETIPRSSAQARSTVKSEQGE